MNDSRKIDCPCTYPGCPRNGKCAECIAYHNNMGEFPACFFSKEAEKTYDRGLKKLLEDRNY